MTPKLAVCIPAYNQPAFLREALASLCDQGLRTDDYVVAVADDASPAPLAPVVDEFRSRLQIVYHRHEKNSAISRTGMPHGNWWMRRSSRSWRMTTSWLRDTWAGRWRP